MSTTTIHTVTSTSTIKTKFLILSDTHGRKPKPKLDTDPTTEDELSQDSVPSRKGRYTTYREPLAEVDVVLHCGDLTKRSRVEEFQDTFDMLRAIRAPLKLVIAGNHDFALHEEYFYSEFNGDPQVVAQVRKIVKAAEADGVYYLSEGVHEFTLANGAQLKVYASQFTPSYGGWAFQYYGDHDFNIPEGVDVAMTHGPPLGVLDHSLMGGTNAGCPHLFRAIHRARPKIHCFGHIHEGWGALLARWKDSNGGPVCFKNNIDMDAPRLINMAHLGMREGAFQDEEAESGKEMLISACKQRGVPIDLTEGSMKLEEGVETLFLNAAIMNRRYQASQPSWLVGMNLPRAD
ncbi:Metallo-dependent phosphatase-like protein [Mariannaea sp. PMI_226]|nr:Metallo-dependent phosphatase-like protein [Mariannaea sp. PMI_226]